MVSARLCTSCIILSYVDRCELVEGEIITEHLLVKRRAAAIEKKADQTVQEVLYVNKEYEEQIAFLVKAR